MNYTAVAISLNDLSHSQSDLGTVEVEISRQLRRLRVRLRFLQTESAQSSLVGLPNQWQYCNRAMKGSVFNH